MSADQGLKAAREYPLWKTYGRFPAHCHAIDSAGIWMQCHHIDPDFYVRHFRDAYSPTQAAHAGAWHAGN